MANNNATEGGRTIPARKSTSTLSPAVSQPASGQYATILRYASAGMSSSRQKGRRVKKVRAARMRVISEVLSDVFLFK